VPKHSPGAPLTFAERLRATFAFTSSGQAMHSLHRVGSLTWINAVKTQLLKVGGEMRDISFA